MKNKIWLTSIFALCIATPAMARGQIGLGTQNNVITDENNPSQLAQGKGCDESTLGVTEGTANIEAIWTPNTYTISYTCANGNEPNFMGSQSMLAQANQQANQVDCEEDPTNDECINETYAVYGKWFRFAGSLSCREPGYTTTGWSCTRDSVQNDTATFYAVNYDFNDGTWNIPSDLTCTEVRVGNTIGLNWYDNAQATTPSSTTQCTYGTTSGQGALVLPSQPTAPAGYSFGGWKMVTNICEKLDTQNTCNANTQCFWYIDRNTNTGSCVNTDPNINGCANAVDSTTCTALGYCNYSLKTGGCIFGHLNVCHSMTTQEQCGLHIGSQDNGLNQCVWNETMQSCITMAEELLG